MTTPSSLMSIWVPVSSVSARITAPPERQISFDARLKQANIKAGQATDSRLQLQFNETLLRRDTAYLLAAFAPAR